MNKILVEVMVELAVLVISLVVIAIYIAERCWLIVICAVVDLMNGSSERGRKAGERVCHLHSRIFAKNEKPTCEEDSVI